MTMTVRTTFPITCAAFDKLKFNFRALACEIVFGWAERLAPPGYVPSYIEYALQRYGESADKEKAK